MRSYSTTIHSKRSECVLKLTLLKL